MASSIGNRVAPAKFIAFLGMLVVAAPAAAWFMHRFAQDPLRESAAKGLMLGFDLAALAFLAGCLHLLRVGDPATLREHAEANDANRPMLLVITAIVSVAILAAVAAETMGGEGPGIKTKALIVGTLLIAWLFANSVYALHYAHMVAMKGGGIDFPGKDPPGYADFAYFAFTLGMTFQTSDVNVGDKAIRNVVTFHCLAAFVFNLGILAFTINVLGG
ncbi:MAG: hypothetical protein QOD42_700 [Sphingomonadales bacterium]|jgi:uncharacterized membrane protein|nr:hypothetical protein [Sphingomonadales bacterium]